MLNHGLRAALESLASRASVATTVAFEGPERLPEPVELAAYFVACEALANVAKHAQATQATVRVSRRDGLAVVAHGRIRRQPQARPSRKRACPKS